MSQPVKSLYEMYLSRSDLAESSVEITGRAVRWFTELFGDIDAEQINYGHADDFKAWLAKGRSKSSANTYLRTIKPFFAWLAERRHIEQNPFDKKLRLYVVGEQKRPLYTPDEIERLFAVADLRWKVIVALALNSMRRGEILNLVLSDIDFEKNLILITPKKDTEYTWRWDIKNHNQAYIGLPESVANLLVKLRENLPVKQPYITLKPAAYERNMRLKVAGELDHRLRKCPWGNFNRDFAMLLKRANVKRRRFHDLRSVFATERYRDGYSLKKLQCLLRHSSIQTTARYIKEIEEQKLVAESAETFNKHYASNVP